MRSLSAIVCCVLALLSAAAAEVTPPYFHFDFTGMKGGELESIADKSGKTRLQSRLKLFLIQEDALRVAHSSVFFIPAAQLPDLTKQFTFAAWVKTSKRGDLQPIFVKGYKGKNQQFYFSTSHMHPAGNFRAGGHAQGIFTNGTFHQTVYLLDSLKYATSKPPVEFFPGRWSLLVWVFNRGKLDIYLNGQPIMRYTGTPDCTLTENGEPLFIGCTRDKEDARRNTESGDMRLNDLRLWTTALSADEVKSLYQQESARYAKLASHNSWDPPFDWKCHTYTKRVIPGYDPDFEETVPTTQEYLKTRKAIPVAGNPETKITVKERTARLEIGGKEYFPLLAQSNCGSFNVDIFHPANKIEKMLEDIGAQEFSLVGVKPCPWRDVPLFWKGYKKYDFSAVDELVHKALKAAPNARIQFAIHPEMNHWFQNEHRDSLEISLGQWSSKGSRIVAYHGNMGSDIWIKVSNDMLYELVKHIESQDYAGHVYDYKLFMSGGGEWHWPMCFFGCVGGYSDATRDSFRAWLKEKYKTDEALQKAWNNPAVTLATALVPTPEERKAAEFFIFRDPVKSQSSNDFIHYMNDRTYLEIKQNSEAMKRGCNYRKTVTLYYGYGLHFMGDATKLQTGCNMYQKVLELKSVDHIGSPIDYSTRGLGGAGMNINPFTASAAAHGKMIWQENDLRTHLNPAPEHHGWTANAKQDIQQLRRGFAQAVTSANGFWYFPGYQYHGEVFVREFRSWQRMSGELLKFSRAPIAEAAMIFDEESLYDLSSYGGAFLNGHGKGFLNESAFAGAPMDCWMQGDLDKMPDYKLYFFVNSYRTTPELRAKIKAKLARNHAIAVWFYAPGLIGSDGKFDQKAMEDLTGIRLEMIMTQALGTLKPLDVKHPITSYGLNKTKYLLGPLVTARDPQATNLARLAEFPALTVKKMPQFTSVWTLMPLTRHMIAGIYDFAKIHRFQREGFDVVNANENFLMIHAATAGKKRLYLKAPSCVTELFSGRKLGDKLTVIEDEMEFGDTRLYRVVPAK